MQYRRKEILGIILGLLAVFLMASFVTYDPTESPGGISPDVAKTNIMGIFGIYASYYLMKFSLGWATLFLPLGMGILSFAIFTRKNLQEYLRVVFYISATGVWISSFIAYIGISQNLWWEAEYAGVIGYSFTIFIRDMVGAYAYGILMFVAVVLIISGFFHISIYDELLNFKDFLRAKYNAIKEKRRLKSVIVTPDQSVMHNEIEPEEAKKLDALESTDEVEERNTHTVSNDVLDEFLNSDEIGDSVHEENSISQVDEITEVSELNVNKDEFEAITTKEITIEDEAEIKETDLDSQKERQARYRQYRLPTTDYLADPIEISNPLDRDMLHEKAEHLVHALETFGVKGKVVKISPGPVITLFEIEPGEYPSLFRVPEIEIGVLST